MELQEAMAAINKHAESVAAQQKEMIKGDPGPRGPEGPAGRDGKDGKDAQTPQIKIGSVQTSDDAGTSITDHGSGEFSLHLVLPRALRGLKGDRGERGEGPQGPKGEPGLSIRGPKGDSGRDGVDGAAGKDGAPGAVGPQGPQGERGPAGLGEDDIKEIVKQTILEVLSDVGVMTEQAQKLAAIRAALKGKIDQADSRHIAEISTLVRQVDKLF